MALSLYIHLGKRMLLQLEAYIEHVLLRIAEGKGCTYEHQEAALEVGVASKAAAGEPQHKLTQLGNLSVRASSPGHPGFVSPSGLRSRLICKLGLPHRATERV